MLVQVDINSLVFEVHQKFMVELEKKKSSDNALKHIEQNKVLNMQ